ncbi:MAG: MFS transporter [Chloroflexota bacterium]
MNIRRLGSVSLGHMSVDIMASSIAMILTAVSGKFELTLSQIGLGAMIVMFASSLTQPFFGAWADKLRGRWLGPVGLLWYAFFFFLIPFVPSYTLMIVCLTLGSLGSAAIHTAGMVIAPDAGGDKPTTATSIFFLFGQSGLALGPIITGFILKYQGLAGLPYVAIAILPVVLLMFLFLHEPVRYVGDQERSKGENDRKGNSPTDVSKVAWATLALFMLLILLRSTTFHTYMTFLPAYLDGLGYETDAYGIMIGAFVFGGAVGTLVGGILGDRFNRRLVIFTSLIVAIPFCFIMLGASGLLFYAAAFAAGALLNMSHSILIVIGQALIPNQKGMMSGATLGFMFASGSIMAWLAGEAADVYGLPTIMYVLAIVPVTGALMVLLLPSTRPNTAEGPAVAAAGD